MTKRKMAELLNDAHPEWCFSTCEKRIANWLAVAEYALYIPMRESFAQKRLDFLRINRFNFAKLRQAVSRGEPSA